MSEVVAVDDDTRISSEYRTLLDHLGIEHPDYRLGLQYFPEDLSGAQALLREKGLDGPLALLCPFTTRPQKHWSESRWARLADRLEQDLGLRAVLLGAKPDLAAAERIQDRARQQLTSLVGRTSLRQSLALVEQADLVIGVDTGLTHMAVLSDVPTIALFGPTRPYLQSQNKRAVILYHPFSCSPCKRSPVCQGRYPCMAKHEVDTIFERAKQILRS
jgi:heptosyltransferase-1